MTPEDQQALIRRYTAIARHAKYAFDGERTRAFAISEARKFGRVRIEPQSPHGSHAGSERAVSTRPTRSR